MSDPVEVMSPREAACIGGPGSATPADPRRRGRTLRRVAVAGGLGAGAWLAMMAVGQSHAAATPAPHVAGVLGTAATVVHTVKPLTQAVAPIARVRAPAHVVAETTRTTLPSTRSSAITVAATTASVAHRMSVDAVTPVRTTFTHTTARVTALPVVKPVAKDVEKTVRAVTTTVHRATAPVVAPVVKAVTPIVTPIAGPIVAPITSVAHPTTTPVAGHSKAASVTTARVLRPSTLVAAGAQASVATTAATAATAATGLEHSSTIVGATSTTGPFAAPSCGSHAGESRGQRHSHVASVTNVAVRNKAVNGGGQPFGPVPVPAAMSGVTASAGAHSHDSGPSMAGRNARLARPVSASAARLGSDRLPGAPIRSTDVSPD